MIDKMLDDVIRREGGYVNDPQDRGGETKYGITAKTLAQATGRTDVENITITEAKEIYKSLYYYRPKIDHIHPQIQSVVFDMGVNAGPSRAIRLLQRSINQHLGQPVLVTDGLIGKNTVNKLAQVIQQTGVNRFVNTYTDKRIGYYANIAALDESQQKFLKGWMSRAEEFRA